MKTSAFLTALRANAELPLVFKTGRDVVLPGYHLTEIKRVSYETMDCGAMTHRWAESQFEIWVPAAAGRSHMPADKFLRIIDRVETELPLDGGATARIHASFNGQPAALYDIDDVTARDGMLWVELDPDKTRCKAAERRGASSAGGCCGTSPDEPKEQESSACGCGSAKTETTSAACCA